MDLGIDVEVDGVAFLAPGRPGLDLGAVGHLDVDHVVIGMDTGLHLDFHMINVEMTDGTKFQTRSTWGKEGDTIHLDIDPKVHPAWTGGTRQVQEGGQVARFNKRFGGLSLGKK